MEETIYRAVGYKRVSMRDQLDGHSLDAQEVHIRTYAESQGWKLIKIYTDAGISAKKGSKRPAFEQLLKDAKEEQFDVVIVDKIDRFYRHLGGLLTALEQLNECHVSFASIQEKLDFTTPWGKLMLTMLGMLAEVYLDNLRQEVKKGQKQRARKGLWVGGIPYGYCKGLCRDCTDPNGKDYCPNYGRTTDLGDGKTLLAHPIESLGVKLVFEWYATGQYSARTIAGMLNEHRLKLPDGTEVKFRQKGRKGSSNPGAFTGDLIRDMIQRLAYTGKLSYQGLNPDGEFHKRGPLEDAVNGTHPAIISPELYEKVRYIRETLFRNPKVKQGKPTYVYPLTGVLRCSRCNGPMRGESSEVRRYYADGFHIEMIESDCTQRMVQAEKIEAELSDILKSILAASKGSNVLNSLQTKLAEAEARFERAKELYISGEIKRSEYEEEKRRLELSKKDLRPSRIDATMASVSFIKTQLPNWAAHSLREQKGLIRLTLEAAWVQDNSVVALQPTPAFLPILEGILSGNFGEDARTPPCYHSNPWIVETETQSMAELLR